MSNALRAHFETDAGTTGWLANRTSEDRTVAELAGRDGETLRFEGPTDATLLRR